MAELKKIRIQLLNTKTGEVMEEVNPLTSSTAVLFRDGQTLDEKLQAGELKGNKGDRGTIWYTGTTVSKTALTASVPGVIDGDIYLNSATYDLFKYSSSNHTWVYVANIKGATGIQGATGPKGATGATGPKGDTGATGPKGDTGATGPKGNTGATGQRGTRWNTGTAITGTNTTAAVYNTGITDSLVGDYYLNNSTGLFYQCTTAGNASKAQWVYKGSIKGATGKDGDNIKVGTSYSTGTDVKLFLKVVE